MREPRERQLPNDMLQMASTSAYVGYWMGQGIGFIQAGSSANPIDVITRGVLLRNSAIGVLVAGSVGMAYPVAAWLVSLCSRRAGYAYFEDSDDQLIERKGKVYLPSSHKFMTWDLRTLVASQAAAVLAAVIMTNTGDVDQKAFGDLVGRSIGSFVGAIIGFLMSPWLLRKIEDCIAEPDVEEIAPSKWYKESRHRIQFYARLFFGFWAGYVALEVLSTPKNEFGFLDMDKFNQDRLIGTVVLGATAFLSPVFFAILRLGIQRFYPQSNSVSETARFEPPRWYAGSRMDFHWYMRLFSLTVVAVTVALVQMKYNQAEEANKNFVYAAFALKFVTPLLSELFEKIIQRVNPGYFEAQQLDNPPPVKLSYDMPMETRVAFAALSGSMIGDAFFYATTNAETYDFRSPPSHLPVIFMWTLISLSIVRPALMAAIDRCGFRHEIFNPTDPKKDDLRWPVEVRLLSGLMLGALVGASVAYFTKDTKDISTIPGFIGPDFLGINNEYAAPTTSIVFGVGTLLWPLAQFAWDRIESTGLCGYMTCFQRNADRDDIGRGESELIAAHLPQRYDF